jgi:UDP-N-acetylmuramoylalanine--D-glutamate ligase
MTLKNKKITVIGLGVSGSAVAELLHEIGASVYAADSCVSETLKEKAGGLTSKGIIVELGCYNRQNIESSDLLVVSPGVRDFAEPLQIAREKKIPITSEIEIASQLCKGEIAAITGSNGKTTIVTLIGLMLEASGRRPVVCGNIGKAFSGEVLSIKEHQPVVLEASSFQLKSIDRFRPKISLVSNISQNHLDFHSDFQDYFNSKKNIYKNQQYDDFCLLNYDDEQLKLIQPKPKSRLYFFSTKKQIDGAYIDSGAFILNFDKKQVKICDTSDLQIKGEHNYSNVLAASACAYLLGAHPDKIQETIKNFKGLHHRFESFYRINGVTYIDDSKATSVAACAAALKGCPGRVILIAGGKDKGSDYSAIEALIHEKVKAVIAIGEARYKISNAFSKITRVQQASSMEQAVMISKDNAISGDIVLLSPMCASFDMYQNYSERGAIFKQEVFKLHSQAAKR